MDAPPTGPAGTTLPQGCSRIAAVDLSMTMPALAASAELRGRVVPGGLHRFGDVVSVLVEATTDQAKQPVDPRPPTLINLRANVPSSLTTIGELALPFGRNGIPPRFRFDVGRLFLATDDPTTPLIVVQGTAVTAPAITGRLPAGSIVSEISHIEGDRLLITEQQVRDGQCPVRGLSLHQLGAGNQLSLLARTPVPFEADGGVTVLGGGLVAQAGRDINEVDGFRAPRIALQLFDLDLAAGTLAARGRVVLTGATLASLLAAGPARLVALSSERAETVDATDRGSPRTEGALDLARWIQDVGFAGGHAVTLVNNDFGGGGFLHLSPADDPDAARPLATWPLEGQVGRLFTHDRFVYLFWHASRRVGRSDPAAGRVRGRGQQPAPPLVAVARWSRPAGAGVGERRRWPRRPGVAAGLGHDVRRDPEQGERLQPGRGDDRGQLDARPSGHLCASGSTSAGPAAGGARHRRFPGGGRDPRDARRRLPGLGGRSDGDRRARSGRAPDRLLGEVAWNRRARHVRDSGKYAVRAPERGHRVCRPWADRAANRSGASCTS